MILFSLIEGPGTGSAATLRAVSFEMLKRDTQMRYLQHSEILQKLEGIPRGDYLAR
jgi:hypothetical protein